jgi:RNA polymerase sigma factor (sigma-70 family)
LPIRPLSERNALAEEHWEWARSIAADVSRRLPTWFRAEDLEGAAALGLLRAASRYDAGRVGEGHAAAPAFRQYALQIVRGACYSAVRRNEYRERSHSDLRAITGGRTDIEDPAAEADPEQLAGRRERDAAVNAAVEKLNPDLRRVIRRVYYEEATLEELSREFGLCASRMSQLHRRALQMLRGLLAGKI